MGSVYDEITRLETAKTDIETAIENCGVNVPSTKLISDYASYIRQIPSAVFSGLNVDPVGGDDKYIKIIELKNGLISATTGGLVSSTSSGLAPKVINTNTATVGSAYYVLASSNGSTIPSWYKLPTSAFKNDNTTYTFANGTTGNFTVTPSGGTKQIVSIGKPSTAGIADDAVKLQTKRKLWGLDFDGSANVSGDMTGVGNITINATDNKDYFINFLYNSTPAYSWRLGYLGSGSENANYFVIDSSKSSGGTWHRALQIGNETLNATFAGSVIAPTFTGNLDGAYVNALTDYTKSTTASDIVATDTLNAALGKLEYKADYAYDWVISVTASDTDEYINKWSEIVGFLDSIKEGTNILDEFVTRKTDLTITGLKVFESNSSITGVSLILKNKGWAVDMSTAMDFYNGSAYTVPNARIATYMNGDGRSGGTLIFYTQTKHNSTNPNPNSLTERFRIGDDGISKITGDFTVTGNVSATGFLKSDSSNNHVLLGGGGHKALSDFLLETEFASKELGSNLTTITKTLVVSKDWVDTGIVFNAATFPNGTGSYIVQLSRDDAYYWTGCLSIVISNNVTVGDSDEILLHGGGFDSGFLYYLRTVHDITNKVVKLQIARNSTYSTSKTYTFKFKKLI